jgi:hypothetical protein
MLPILFDEGLNNHVLRGFRRRFPDLRIQRVQDMLPLGTPDPEVLSWAAERGYVPDNMLNILPTMGSNRRFCMNKSRLLSLIAAAALLLLDGCVLVSVAPFYGPNDPIFEEGLVGEWIENNDVQQDEPDERWKFEKQDDLSYKFSWLQKNKPAVISQAHLFKLGDQLLLDFTQEAGGDETFPPRIPSHLLVRIDQLKPRLKGATMKYEWVVEFLDKNPKALRHHIINNDAKAANRELLLTASTEELKRFVAEHLKTEAAWNNFELKRALVFRADASR